MKEAKFLTELEVREGVEEGKWELTTPLRYYSAILDREIEVPKGFVTDFASVPRVPIVYNLFGDRAHRESVIHDYLYQTHGATKAVADKVFLEAMKARKKPLFVRWGMYLGVRIGGYSSYKSGPSRFTILNGAAKAVILLSLLALAGCFRGSYYKIEFQNVAGVGKDGEIRMMNGEVSGNNLTSKTVLVEFPRAFKLVKDEILGKVK